MRIRMIATSLCLLAISLLILVQTALACGPSCE